MKVKTELHYFKKTFKSGCNIDINKKYGHLFTFAFQFLFWWGFISIKK